MANLFLKFDDVEKIDIINTKGMTAQEVKAKYNPDVFMNLALYDMGTGENITHLEDENVKSGYLFSEEGIGIQEEKTLIWCNKGMAFGDDSIRDFVSGSPVLVCKGKKVKDWGNKYSSYVDGSHTRCALGFNKEGIILIHKSTPCTLDTLADDAIRHANATYLINCDGGGSCHLQDKHTIYARSSRKNASWILIYLKKKRVSQWTIL